MIAGVLIDSIWTGARMTILLKPKSIEFAKLSIILLLSILFVGCQTMKPIHTVRSVDLKRIMGDWYVIASIPTFIEKDAYNAMESYRRDEDGTVATTFRFNKGSMDGPLKEYSPRGFIKDRFSKAVWVCSLSGRSKQNIELFSSVKTIRQLLSAEQSGTMCGFWPESLQSPMRNTLLF
jgi:hypothetical protein